MKSTISFFAFFLVFALMHPHNGVAQQHSVLRLIVYSGKDGNPLTGTNILLYKKGKQFNDNFRYGGSTNSNGFLELRGVAPGQYQLKVSYIGYQMYRQTITLKANDIKIVELTLTPKVGELEELVVEAERDIEVGEVGLAKISPEEIARIPTPGPGGDLASYLQTLPGVVMTGDRGGELYVRGGTPTQNLVLVNNMPIVKPFHISNLFSAFPSSIIQSVDVYAGGFDAKYIGATSAVIDVSLRAGNMRRYEADVGLSSHIVTVKLEGPIERDQKSFLVVARKSIIDQTDTYLSSRRVPIDFYDIMASYTFRPNGFSCSISGLRTYDQGQINPARNISLSWSNTVVGATCLGYNDTFNYPVEMTFGYSSYSNSETSPAREITSSGVSQIFAKVETQRQILGLPAIYNFELYYQSYHTVLNERFTRLESFDRIQSVAKGSVSLIWEVNEDVTAEPSLGTQLTLHNVTLEPRLRISYHPDDAYEVSIALGKYNQNMIGITDQRDAGTTFTVLKPGKDIPLPEALHGLIGFNAALGNGFEAKLGAYVIKRNNISVAKWNPIAKVEIETALADGLSYGFDARLKYDKNPFYASLSYGWAKTKYEATTEALGAWVGGKVFSYFPPHDRRHKISAVASAAFAGFTAGLSWTYGSGRPFTRVFGFDLALNFPEVFLPIDFPTKEPGVARTLFSRPYGARLPSVHQLDVSLERSFELSTHVSLDAEIGVINVYGRKNIFYFDSNTLQRVNQTPFLPYFTIVAEFNS